MKTRYNTEFDRLIHKIMKIYAEVNIVTKIRCIFWYDNMILTWYTLNGKMNLPDQSACMKNKPKFLVLGMLLPFSVVQRTNKTLLK